MASPAPGSPPSNVLPPPGAISFDNTLGALLVGGLVAMALWGVTCVQTFTFFTHTSRDNKSFRFLIAFLLVLDTFDSILDGHILYFYLVSNYLNPLAIMIPIWSVILHVAITSISNFIIRSMFARRIYRLSGKNIILTAWIVAVSLSDLIIGLYITARAFHLHSYLELDVLSGPFYANFAAGTTSDLSVALALCYLLYISRTGFPRTDSLIRVLMLYTINTGLIVALDASLGMITYIVMPHNFVFLGFYLLLSKLYLNSYLASLNARSGLRERSNEPHSIHLSSLSPSSLGRFAISDPSRHQQTQSGISGMHIPARPGMGFAEKGIHSEMGVSVTTVEKRYHDDSSSLSPGQVV